MQPNLFHPCLVYSLQMLLGVSALQPLSLKYRYRQTSSESSLSGDTGTLRWQLNNALNRSVTQSFDIFFLVVHRSSPKIPSFIWRLTSALRCRKCALKPIQNVSLRTTSASSCSCGRLRLPLRSGPTSLADVRPVSWTTNLRVYVPLLMPPWMMQACHVNASYHLSVVRKLLVLECGFWWIGMDIYPRWWFRLSPAPGANISQADGTLAHPLSPLVSLLSSGSGVAVSVEYFGAVPVTPRGNIYTYAVSAARTPHSEGELCNRGI